MTYFGMPFGMWTMFAGSFQKQLTVVFGYDVDTAKTITKKAKPKYREIISELPEFEKGDRFKMNLVNCAMIGAFILSMPERPKVGRLTDYYAKSMMTKPMKWFCRMSGKSKFTEKDIAGMKATAALRAADRNPYSWNMELYEYPDDSGYEGRFTKCGICVLMKKLGLYDLTPALCRLDYTMSEMGGATDFVRQYTLASGGPYCDCGTALFLAGQGAECLFDMWLNALQIVHGYVERLPAIGCWDAPRMAVKTSLKNVGDNMDGDTHVWSIPLYVLWCLKSYLYHEMDW